MKLILFDGHCGLCNKLVDYVLKKDRNHIFKLAPIQGTTAKSLNFLNDKLDTTNPTSMVYIESKDRIYYKSDASLKVLSELSRFGGIYRALLYIPKSLRTLCYDLVARHRYNIFGRIDTCRLPTRGEKDRLLP